MNKYLKWGLISLGGLIVLFVLVILLFGKSITKSFSPQETALYESGSTKITVDYSRPFKKEREIFGGLVPYNEIWRTGANEATVFTSNQDLTIDGQILKAGKYTLYTIPTPDSWQVVWNNKEYSWGLNFDGTSPFEREYDVLIVEMPVTRLPNIVEQFTITIGQSKGMTLAWDQTEVSVPIGL